MKRHQLDVLSLGSGAVFVAFALAHLVATAVGVILNPGVTLSLLLVGLAVTAIATLLVSQRSQQAQDGVVATSNEPTPTP